jgi:transcriptional regulator with XRE-family HTH domain
MFNENGQKPAIVESEIGKRIKAFRTTKGIPLEQLVSQAEFTKGCLSTVEKSEKSPPVSTLGIIVRAFGETISAIQGEESHSALFLSCQKRGKALDFERWQFFRIFLYNYRL